MQTDPTRPTGTITSEHLKTVAPATAQPSTKTTEVTVVSNIDKPSTLKTVQPPTIPVQTEINSQIHADVRFEKLDRALANCDVDGGRTSICGLANSHIYTALKRAYSVYIEVIDDNECHQRAIDDIMRVDPSRERSPSLRKPAYNSTCRALHPKTKGEYEQCSEWANVINWAAMIGVTESDFTAWVTGKTVKDAKKAVRSAKKAKEDDVNKQKKPSKLKVPFTDADFPYLARACAIIDDPAWTEKMKAAFSSMESELAKAIESFH